MPRACGECSAKSVACVACLLGARAKFGGSHASFSCFALGANGSHNAKLSIVNVAASTRPMTSPAKGSPRTYAPQMIPIDCGFASACWNSWCDLLATVPTTQQGAIAMIDAFLLHQEADMDRTQYSALLTRLKVFLQSAWE